MDEKTLEEMKTRIYEELDDAICGIFVKHQNELGITSGDIDPWDSLELDETHDKLAEIITKVLQFETVFK